MIVKTIKTMGTPGRGPPSPRNVTRIIRLHTTTTLPPPQGVDLPGGAVLWVVGYPHPSRDAAGWKNRREGTGNLVETSKKQHVDAAEKGLGTGNVRGAEGQT